MKIFIQGLKDGDDPVDIEANVSEIKDLPEEFIGKIRLNGSMRIFNKRYTIQTQIISRGKFICDLSLEEYEEDLTCDFSITFLANNLLAGAAKENPDKETEENYIFEDVKHIDVTNEIREELIVSLPLKRVAPKYRDKSFEEIYPQFAEKKKSKQKKDQAFDDRWSALKNLKFN